MARIRNRFGSLRQVIRRLRNRDMISPKLALCSLVTGIITGAVCSFFETIPVALSESRLAFLGSVTWGPVAVFLMAFLTLAFLPTFKRLVSLQT